jgi:hypothetical protein
MLHLFTTGCTTKIGGRCRKRILENAFRDHVNKPLRLPRLLLKDYYFKDVPTVDDAIQFLGVADGQGTL